MSRGGNRPGSGRRRVPSKAYTIRVPLRDVEVFEESLKLIADFKGISKNFVMSNALVDGVVTKACEIDSLQLNLPL